MLRIAIIRFWYEGNAFSPALARREDFIAREWLWGSAAQDFYTGQALETGAGVDFLREHADVRGEFVLCAAAYPAGPIQAGLATEILARVEAGLAEHHWDGVYLSLHGSSVFEDVQGFETLLLERVRKQVGNIPLAASLPCTPSSSGRKGGACDNYFLLIWDKGKNVPCGKKLLRWFTKWRKVK